MKVFTVEYQGIVLGGYAVVVAKDRRQARRLLKKDEAIDDDFEIISEIDIEHPNVEVLM